MVTFFRKKRRLLYLMVIITVLSSFAIIKLADDEILFPLQKDVLEKNLNKTNLDWHVGEEYSLDENNSVYQLKSEEHDEQLILSSMNKDGMTSLGLAINGIDANSDLTQDKTFSKKLIYLTCRLSGIKNKTVVFNDLLSYMSKRDNRIFGDAIWYFKENDKIISVNLKSSHLNSNAYHIQSISVENIKYFDEKRKIFASYQTERLSNYPELDVPVYKDINIKDLNNNKLEHEQDIVRMVIKGKLSEIHLSSKEEMDNMFLSKTDFNIYVGDYAKSTITDNTGTITVFVPIYFLFIPDLALEEKQWHINYYSIDNIYYVDYGLNIPQ